MFVEFFLSIETTLKTWLLVIVRHFGTKEIISYLQNFSNSMFGTHRSVVYSL